MPAGEITGKTIEDLASHLEKGDTVIDGGNSYYRDDIRRAGELSKRGIHLIERRGMGDRPRLLPHDRGRVWRR